MPRAVVAAANLVPPPRLMPRRPSWETWTSNCGRLPTCCLQCGGYDMLQSGSGRGQWLGDVPAISLPITALTWHRGAL